MRRFDIGKLWRWVQHTTDVLLTKKDGSEFVVHKVLKHFDAERTVPGQVGLPVCTTWFNFWKEKLDEASPGLRPDDGDKITVLSEAGTHGEDSTYTVAEEGVDVCNHGKRFRARVRQNVR